METVVGLRARPTLTEQSADCVTKALAIGQTLRLPLRSDDVTKRQDQLAEAQELCCAYISFCLQRRDLQQKNPLDERLSRPSWALRALRVLTNDLERHHPCLYKYGYRKWNTSMYTDMALSDFFNLYTTALFEEGVSWGKIAALYCVLGELAVGCVEMGRENLIQKLVDLNGELVDNTLADWLANNGGWYGLHSKLFVKLEEDEVANLDRRFLRLIFTMLAGISFMLALLLYFAYSYGDDTGNTVKEFNKKPTTSN